MTEKESRRLTDIGCAAIIVRARQEAEARGLSDLTPTGLARTLGVSRSQIYARAAALDDELSQKGPGRPKKEPNDPAPQQVYIVMTAVRDFLMDNPGAVYKRTARYVYSDEFRAFVLDVISPDGLGESLTATQAAQATGVPVHTINSWRTNGRRRVQKVTREAPAAPLALDDSTPLFSPEVERLIKLYEAWKGNFSGFCASLPGHNIHLSAEKVAQVLDLADVRPRPRRKRVQVDAETLRGGLERFFANAQLCEDGKNVAITLGDRKYVFTWQVMVDVATNAVVGFDVRPAEDGQGFLNALEQATQAAAEPPLSTMRDRRKCNVSKAVEDALQDQDIESILTPKKRPQTNGPAENLFSLLAQSMPEIIVQAETPEKLAQSLLWYILTAFALGRNLAPRKTLKGLSPGEAFDQQKADEQTRQKARAKLKKRAADSRRERKRGGTRKEAPVVRDLLRTEFDELGVDDPKEKTATFLSKLGIDVALESVAILRARLESGFDPNASKAGYLRGIATRVANRNEDMAQYHHHLRLRSKAGELLLRPLETLLEQMRQKLQPGDLLRELVRKSHAAQSKAERQFWWRAALTEFASISPNRRKATGEWMASRTANRRSIHLYEKDWMIAQVAKVASGYPM